jgi:hypothetical protein
MLDTPAKHGFRETTTVPDGMAIDWDIPITMEHDGGWLSAGKLSLAADHPAQMTANK